MGEPVRLSKEEIGKLIDTIDSLTESPTKRGAKLFKKLQAAHGHDTDSYDLLCFCITSLPGLLVQQSAFDPRLAASLKYLNIWLSDAHYQGRLWDTASHSQQSKK